MRPAIFMPSSIGVLAIMIAVTVIAARPERDVVIFIVGSSVGVFLEYWGTSRGCWTYWTTKCHPIRRSLPMASPRSPLHAGFRLADALSECTGKCRMEGGWRRRSVER